MSGWIFVGLDRVLPAIVERQLEKIYLEQGLNE
jgi:hypothetical protein